MKQIQLLTLFQKPAVTFLYFLFLGSVALIILASKLQLSTIMQILALLIFTILIFAKFVLPKIQQPVKTWVLLPGLLPLVLFIYLLIFSTGGLSSPFLILTHLFVIGAAFSLSPQIAISFITATIILVLANLTIDSSAQAFLLETPIAAFLYFLAYIALIPFAYILSKEYKIKEEWIKILEKQIATSKSQEEELLKNIADSVFILNRNFELVYQNSQAVKLLGYGKEILSQDFFKFFSFKDKDGRNLKPYSLPFEQTLSSKVQTVLKNIQIQEKAKNYIHVNMKILPAIGAEGPLGLILIIQDLSRKVEVEKKEESTAIQALERFLSFLTQQKQIFFTFEKIVSVEKQAKNLIKQNEELEHLVQDFIYALRLEAGEIGTTWTLCDLGKILEELIESRKTLAQDLGVTLTPKLAQGTEKIVPPKTGVQIPQVKQIFPVTNIIGNASWIRDSLKRILELALIICYKGKAVEIELVRNNKIAQIRIFCPQNLILPEATQDLFEKFYGRLANLPELFQTSGLEGFIAKNLIEKMGGSISAAVEKAKPALIIQISFGLKTD